MATAAEYAAGRVDAVRDDPAGRLALLGSLYAAPPGWPELRLPYRRAALAFMRWQLRRGLLAPVDGEASGSAWWRAVNERLLRDTAEARGHVVGMGGPISSPSAASSVAFARRPSARAWYRAHNASVVAAYLDHRALADAEGYVERFFLNLVLVRVLYAHALVAAPRLAMGWLGPVAPLLGDPRVRMTGIFLSLSRVLPDRYPLQGDLQGHIDDEHGLGRLLDVGMIVPRLDALYSWSAAELSIPELTGLIRNRVPCYAWDPSDRKPWDPAPNLVVRALRWMVPPGGTSAAGGSTV
ncbi:hypothetical protein [Parafrankia sp. EUN1f]|uniref:hypothetical protein n=1 Tax=Parafrankia sp. EUN1f TaxID=102897 RepID=UPI0001C446EF|nr:hypothetical protein [Parafrankia sp. EUN1f]EFC84124.1 hypothetical protein FrEUN1fDRAFT_2735 [Parafrankia sp. EUN1f]